MNPNSTKTEYQLLEPINFQNANSESNKTTTINVSSGMSSDGFNKYINDIFFILLLVIVVISVFMLMYGGVLYLTKDIGSKVSEGKKMITGVFSGLVFIFTIWLIFYTVNPRFLEKGIVFGVMSYLGGSSTESITVSTECKQMLGTLQLGGLDKSYYKKKLEDLTESEIVKLQTGIQKQEGSSPKGVTNNPGNIKYGKNITSCTDSGVSATDGGTFISCPNMEAYHKVEQDIIKGYITKFKGITVGDTISKWKGLPLGLICEGDNTGPIATNIPNTGASAVSGANTAICTKGTTSNVSPLVNTYNRETCIDLLEKVKLAQQSFGSTIIMTSSIRSEKAASPCHYSDNPQKGNCMDLVPQNGNYSDLCKALLKVGKVGILNESGSFNADCGGAFIKTANWTGAHIHINLIK